MKAVGAASDGAAGNDSAISPRATRLPPRTSQAGGRYIRPPHDESIESRVPPRVPNPGARLNTQSSSGDRLVVAGASNRHLRFAHRGSHESAMRGLPARSRSCDRCARRSQGTSASVTSRSSWRLRRCCCASARCSDPAPPACAPGAPHWRTACLLQFEMTSSMSVVGYSNSRPKRLRWCSPLRKPPTSAHRSKRSSTHSPGATKRRADKPGPPVVRVGYCLRIPRWARMELASTDLSCRSAPIDD